MGVFANAVGLIANPDLRGSVKTREKMHDGGRGLAEWLLARLHRRSLAEPRLCLVERINIAPRQTLALIEADGQRLLVATSPEGAPAFYPLCGPSSRRAARSKGAKEGKAVL